MKLEFVVRVWDLPTKALLFEGASDQVAPEHVVQILGLSDDDPEVWGGEYEATPEQGQRLLELMGLNYSGSGTFRVSREAS